MLHRSIVISIMVGLLDLVGLLLHLHRLLHLMLKMLTNLGARVASKTLRTACIKADLAEGCLGRSLAAIVAAGAVIAAVVKFF